MPSRRNRLLLVGGTAAACLLSQAALAELTVLRRAGPSAASYKVGAKLPDNHRFVLRAGDTITIRRSQGGQLVIRGPGAGTAEILSRRAPASHHNTPRSGN